MFTGFFIGIAVGYILFILFCFLPLWKDLVQSWDSDYPPAMWDEKKHEFRK